MARSFRDDRWSTCRNLSLTVGLGLVAGEDAQLTGAGSHGQGVATTVGLAAGFVCASAIEFMNGRHAAAR